MALENYRGQPTFRINTPAGEYYYHMAGAGFASLIDTAGNDWISYKPGGGSAGEYRGIPNMGYPEGYNHPGKTRSSSQLVNDGPVKATIFSESNDGNWIGQWEIYPTHARMTVLQTSHPYWFLYEGTPGGQLNEDTDYMMLSPGTQSDRRAASEKWTGDIRSEKGIGEWIYFGDGNTVLYLVHHEDDQETDSYWPMNGEMTVFGFGRDGLNKYMEKLPQTFSIGLVHDSTKKVVREVIRSISVPLRMSVGALQSLNPE
jgi:hypothetical protein